MSSVAPPAQSEAVLALLQRARERAHAGDPRALADFEAVLAAAPECIEPRLFLAGVALAGGDPATAVRHLEAACEHAPSDPRLWLQRARAELAAGSGEGASVAIETGLRLAPESVEARLVQGQVLERAGRRHDAARAYFRAVSTAQLAGQWRDAASTPAHLSAQVQHAVAFARSARGEMFDALLAPLRERHGAEPLRRVQRALAGYLGIASHVPPDPRQRPKFLYVPGLPDEPVIDTGLFGWIPRLEAEFEAIRSEARAVLTRDDALQPFLQFRASDRIEHYLANEEAPPVWDAFFFYRHGGKERAAATACPRTSSVLEALPLVRIRDHAPEICFSLLSPGTHILPHHGVTNARVVVHLPLVVPPGDCAITVGGHRHAWRDGECFAFDDTYLHEAWNRSGETRCVLLMDAWNPHLTAIEREALTALIEGIGDFNRG